MRRGILGMGTMANFCHKVAKIYHYLRKATLLAKRKSLSDHNLADRLFPRGS
jgi:hypothetical protein